MMKDEIAASEVKHRNVIELIKSGTDTLTDETGS